MIPCISCRGYRVFSCLSLLILSHIVSGQPLAVHPGFMDRNVSTIVESVVRTTEISVSVNESHDEDNYLIDSEQDLEVAESIIDIIRGGGGNDEPDTTEASAQTIKPTFIMVPTGNGQFITPQLGLQPQVTTTNQNQEAQAPLAPQIILMPTPMLGQSGALGAPGGRRRLVRVVRGGGGGRGGPRGFGRAQAMRGAGGIMGPRGRRLVGPAPIRQVMALEDTGFGAGGLRQQQQPQVLQPIVIQAPAAVQQKDSDRFESSRATRNRERDYDKERQPAIIQVITPAAPPPVQQQPRTVIIREPLFPSHHNSPPQPIIQSVVASSAPTPSLHTHNPTIQELLSQSHQLSHPHNIHPVASASGHSQVTTHSQPNPHGGVSNTIVIQPPLKGRDKRRQKRLERMRKRLHDLIIASDSDG
jgi:hypothetical protein